MQKMEYLSLDGIPEEPEEAEVYISPAPPAPIRIPVPPARIHTPLIPVVTPEVTPCIIAYYVCIVAILLVLIGGVLYALTGYNPL